MYENEENILSRSKAILEKRDIEPSALFEEYALLLNAYENLLSDTQFITKVSDRLQRKLNTINDDLLNQTLQLENAQEVIMKQNEELKASKENLENMVKDRTKELKEAYDDLLMANSELNNFAYRAHHDLKGPIARILGLCYVALRDIEEKKAIDYFQFVYNNAENMQEVMRRLLSINRLRETEVVKTQFQLQTVIEHVEKTFEPITKNDDVDVTYKYKPFLLYTDPDFLTELVSNMLEYALRNSTTPQAANSEQRNSIIKFNFIEQNGNLQVYISHNGKKIPERLSKEIFELFHRTNNHPQHTGTELYTANLAVRKLNGTLDLISSSKEETVFSIFLPRVVQ